MLFGASYYHEYQPYERLEADLDLMIEAGFTMIRVGESTWSSYEPVDGEISFEALRRVVEAATQRGLKVVVGTPSYAIPPWLARAHPDILAVTADGGRIAYGGRQNVDFTNPTFLRYVERIVRTMAEEFAPITGAIGFQVDNEICVLSIANDPVVNRFRAHVEERVGSVEEVNAKWGLTYWSQRLSSFEDLWAPQGNTNPGYALEWDRFQARLAYEFLSWQKGLLAEYLRPEQFVIHDLVGGESNPNVSPRSIAELMDRSAVNIYAPLQRALELPEPASDEIADLTPWAPRDADCGAWLTHWKADMAYSMKGSKGSRFLVMEAQAHSIGHSAKNITPYPGQLRLIAHEFAARGADLLSYWHWHTLHFGAETYWGGVLGHDLKPGRIYREVSELGTELRILRPFYENSTPDADVAILYSWESHKALEQMPALALPDSSLGDRQTYRRIFTRFYQGALDNDLQVRIAHPDSDWDSEKVLIVPALYISEDSLLDRLTAAAEGGCHVILTFRSGFADEWARVRTDVQPGRLAGVLGASYMEYTSLVEPVPLVAAPIAHVPLLRIDEHAQAEGWADGLTVDSADTLVGYEDPFLGQFSAVATRQVGAGRITWVGTLPDRGTAGALVSWAAQERGVVPASADWLGLPDSVRVSSATRACGSRLWTVANHSWDRVSVPVPDGMRLNEPTTGTTVTDNLEFGPWDSRVFVAEIAGSSDLSVG